MDNLNLDPNRYDTDKLVHTHYLSNYQEHFGRLADQEVRLFELGIKNGGSLLLWRDYFKKGQIVGLDIEPVRLDDPTGRIRVYQGAQQDTELLDRIARETAPDGFDIVIDDCSHIGVLTRVSFWHLFEHHLKSGGLYVIEDWGTGYWDDWVDGARYKPRPRAAYNHALYRLIRICARLQSFPAVRAIPMAAPLLVKIKSLLLRRQYHSHDIGMVGVVKELIDECGMADITHPEFGIAQHRTSKFREMRLSPSHLFIFKA
jgi:SAM-dependent methyltransferase